jgi:1-acyl-sn-glycerol-3-phosphate acyltransferase
MNTLRPYPMTKPEISAPCKPVKALFDLIVTLLLWSYYTLGFIFFFSPFYLTAYLFSENRERSFQRLNHEFYKGFFLAARILIPWTKWRIQDEVRAIRSSVIVCNHISYLDPILLISLFEQHRTIVKKRFFNMPIFGRVIELSGYIPSSSEGDLSGLMIRRMEEMDSYLASGGNLFVFPEGTRSRDGTIGRLNKGAFKIAKFCKKPVIVLYVRNTDKLFQPGRFLFNTCVPNLVTVEQLASIEPDDQRTASSVSGLMSRVKILMEEERGKQDTEFRRCGDR